MQTPPRAMLVATAKNEGPYLLEWVAFHLEAGFTDIVIYQNDSDDLTPEILALLDRLGVIRYFDNPAIRRGAHQVRAYTRAAELPEYHSCDYAMALDLDEFLLIKTGNGTLADLVAAAPDFDLMHVNWRLFGHSDKRLPSFRLQTERFTMADYVMADEHHLNAFKALFRPAQFERAGVHQPKLPDGAAPTLRCCNGSGLAEGAYQVVNYNSTDPAGQSLVQINHYAVRDVDSFLLKTQRGSAHQADREVGLKYWAQRNRNYVEDLSAHRFLARTEERIRVLDEIADGELLRLRRRSVALHKERIEALLQTPALRRMRRDCIKLDGRLPITGDFREVL